MKKQKLLTTVSVALVLSFLGATALQARPGRRMHDPAKRIEHMKKALNLSDDQTAKMKAIVEKFKAQRESLQERMKKSHDAFRTLITSDNANRSTVKTQLEEIARLKVEKGLLRFDQRQEMSAIMTAEQKQKWKEMMKKRFKKHMQHHKGPQAKEDV